VFDLTADDKLSGDDEHIVGVVANASPPSTTWPAITRTRTPSGTGRVAAT
jgi:hypothetical protein